MKVREIRDKLSIWAKEGKVSPLPSADLGVTFRPQKFSSYREMNEWKARLLEQIARRGGVKWTKSCEQRKRLGLVWGWDCAREGRS